MTTTLPPATVGTSVMYGLWPCPEQLTFAVARDEALHALAGLCADIRVLPTRDPVVVVIADQVDLLTSGRQLGIPSAQLRADAARLGFRRGTVLIAASVPVRHLDYGVAA